VLALHQVHVAEHEIREAGDVPVQGFLHVYVRLAPGETPPDLAGWQAAVDLVAGGTDVAFIAPWAEIPPGSTHPALLASNFLANFGADNGAARASATAFLDTGATPFVDQAGLMRVPFEVAPGAAGAFAVTLDLDAFSGTALSDATISSIPFTAVDGVIAVTPAPHLVPALGDAGLLLLAGSLLLASILVRRAP
jgi:hypothetical protein